MSSINQLDASTNGKWCVHMIISKLDWLYIRNTLETPRLHAINFIYTQLQSLGLLQSSIGLNCYVCRSQLVCDDIVHSYSYKRLLQ